MFRYCTIGLFAVMLWTLPVAGQEKLTLSPRPTDAAVQTARELIKSAETAPTKLPVGGYATIDIKLPGKLTVYVVPGSDDCLQKLMIPKGQSYEGWLFVSDTFKWTKLDPVDNDRVLVTGLKAGQATLIWMAVKGDEAVVVAAFQFLVGGVTPAPVDPIDPDDATNALAKAAKADIKANKGDVDDVQAYASLFSMYAVQVKNGNKLATVGDLYNAMKGSIEQLLGDDVTKTLPSLRQAVAAELSAKLPTDALKALDTNRLAISAELASVAKRLQGVK